jgi:GT2 family glycosyltransferase
MEMALPSLIAALKRLPLDSAIIVFDAGSTDGSRDYVRQLADKHPNLPIHLLEPEPADRSSFADGCNQAIACAQEWFPDLEWCLFYETDNLFVNPDALSQAVQFLDNEKRLGGTGFTVERMDGQKTGYGCRFPGVLSFVFGQRLAARFLMDTPSALPWRVGKTDVRWSMCDVVFTSPLLIRLQAWRESGSMNAKEFPFTDSDLEWCRRATEHGWPMAVLDLPGVVHDNGGAVSQWSGRRVLWFHQSRMRLLSQWYPVRAVAIIPLLFFRHVFEVIVLALTSIRSSGARQALPTRIKLLKGVWTRYASVLAP